MGRRSHDFSPLRVQLANGMHVLLISTAAADRNARTDLAAARGGSAAAGGWQAEDDDDDAPAAALALAVRVGSFSDPPKLQVRRSPSDCSCRGSSPSVAGNCHLL